MVYRCWGWFRELDVIVSNYKEFVLLFECLLLLSSKRKIIFERIFFWKNRRSWWKMNYINLGCLGLREKDPAPGRLNYTSQRPDAQISSFLGPRGFN